MRKIALQDRTLCREGNDFSFREKIEIARLLERLGTDVIVLPAVEDARKDALLGRTLTSFVQQSVLAVECGMTKKSIDEAFASLSGARHPRLTVTLPLSPVGMEYLCKKKPPKMLEWVGEAVACARTLCDDVEFCALDATRADRAFLSQALKVATDAGASALTVCDGVGEMLPDELAGFALGVKKEVSVPLFLRADDSNGLSAAASLLAVKGGIDGVVTTEADHSAAPLSAFAGAIAACGTRYGLSVSLELTELSRVCEKMDRYISNGEKEGAKGSASAEEDSLRLTALDEKETVLSAVRSLGYELSPEDSEIVYEEFRRVAEKKTVGYKELEAVVASVALQVPPTYLLGSYVTVNGNLLTSSAQITLLRDGEEKKGICVGDGPVDAAFHAVEQIIGTHYELDDFRIQAVTEGKEAIGSAVVKLRFGGKAYVGNGISTDIIGAAIRAYLNAVNKILYDEGER